MQRWSRGLRGLIGLCLAGVLVACGGAGEGAARGDPARAAAAGDARKAALAGAAPSVAAFAANGWYWNPDESGTGFMFEAQGDRGFVGFFMYEEGTGKPVWYASEGGAGSFVALADGSYEYTGELRSFSGGQPAWSPRYVNPTYRAIGTVRLRFVGNDATVWLPGRTQAATRFDFNGLGGPVRPHQPETGWYWNPAEGGRGWAIEVQNDRLFMAMFHYNEDGSPTWNVLEADIADGMARDAWLIHADGQSLTSAYRGGSRHTAGRFAVSFRNPCAGQVQLEGAAAVAVRRFVFGGLPPGDECHALAATTGDAVPALEAGEARLQPGDQVIGRIDSPGDVDAWGIALQAGVTYRFEMKGASSGDGTLVDPLLALHGPALQKLAENNNAASGTRNAALTYTPAMSGVVYLVARANGSGTGTFVLSTSGVAADLSALPVLPASSHAGSFQAALSGSERGSVSLLISPAGAVSGSLQLQRGLTVAVTGQVGSGGVLAFAGGGYTFSGIVSPNGEVAATWRYGNDAGGLLLGRGSLAGPMTSRLVVRARGTPHGGVWPTLVLRIDGAVIGSVVVQSAMPADYVFEVPPLRAGAVVEVAFSNDASSAGEDRNLYIGYLSDGTQTVLPTQPGAVVDQGSGEKAWDGQDLRPGQGELYSNGALRLTWPAAPGGAVTGTRVAEAARLLQQASFGPTPAALQRVQTVGEAAWIDEQLGLGRGESYVSFVQRQWDQGAAWRPGGPNYDSLAPVRHFWRRVGSAPDQLRQRMLWALHQIFMVSQADSNLYEHARAYGAYLDMLDRHAFGSYRQLLEDLSLSPVTGIYLSHIRNRREDPATGRVPDENYAREVMQLFSIGLVELNPDGTPRLGADGKPIETYGNDDVMALARVFTGWSWGLPDAQLTENNFRWGGPNYAPDKDTQVDLQRMKAYPNQHSTAEKLIFAGKPWALRIPAGTGAVESLRLALDALANHPNVGPFLGRQLIQRLVTGHPSPAYVARVAAVFADNGRGVRGDLGAVVRAILLDPEARQAPGPGFGKLREPVLRVAAWMRAFGAVSVTGQYHMVWDLEDLSQRPFNAPSVFSYYRPGYVPPNTALAEAGAPAPEFQLLNESTAPAWVNLAEAMAGNGIGWTGTARDVLPDYAPLQSLVAAGRVDALVQQLDQLLFAGRMSQALRTDILDAIAGVGGATEEAQLNRVRVAVFVALASPEFLIQR